MCIGTYRLAGFVAFLRPSGEVLDFEIAQNPPLNYLTAITRLLLAAILSTKHL